jgi:tripartite-type tricarboxylate transporter receptor subunit TctC
MRKCICLILFSITLFVHGPILAQSDFPNKPVTIIVPMGPGGAADLTSRLIGKTAEKYLGQSVVVVNRTGGGGHGGNRCHCRCQAGWIYARAILTSPMVTVPHVTKLTYHPVKDLEPIMQHSVQLRSERASDAPFMSFKEVVDYAKENPGVLTYGTADQHRPAYHYGTDCEKRELGMIQVPFKGGLRS